MYSTVLCELISVLQLSKLGPLPPHPLASVSPPPLVPEGDTLACGRGAQFGRGDRHSGTLGILYMYFVSWSLPSGSADHVLHKAEHVPDGDFLNKNNKRGEGGGAAPISAIWLLPIGPENGPPPPSPSPPPSPHPSLSPSVSSGQRTQNTHTEGWGILSSRKGEKERKLVQTFGQYGKRDSGTHTL